VSAGAIFLDRDGTLNELIPDPVSGYPESPLQVADVTLIAGAAQAARRLHDAGWKLIGVSNQPAAAKGTASLEQLGQIQARVLELAAEVGVEFEDFLICWHHPQGVVRSLSRECDCRKPRPGLLLRAAVDHGIDLSASWMIGDTDADVMAGQAAGCRTLLLEHPGSVHKRATQLYPTAIAGSLADGVSRILSL
jgi:D-glycero-D-manno-heptose 1,7-bisphosphate phosphatase